MIDQLTMQKRKKIVAALHVDLTNEQRTVSATIAANIFANNTAPSTKNGDSFGLHGLSAVELLDQLPTLPHRICQVLQQHFCRRPLLGAALGSLLIL